MKITFLDNQSLLKWTFCRTVFCFTDELQIGKRNRQGDHETKKNSVNYVHRSTTSLKKVETTSIDARETNNGCESMRLMEQLFGSTIPVIVNLAVLLYVCQRFVAATILRRRIMTEMRKFTTIVRRARENLRYIGEQVAKGMDEIKDDVGQELQLTDRLTNRSGKLATLLGRFSCLEEEVIELVRMDPNRESVRVETPANVGEEIEKIVSTMEKRSPDYGRTEWNEDKLNDTGKEEDEDRSIGLPRYPLSKFSVSGPRETLSRKSADIRARVPTTPEVRLLSEPIRSSAPVQSK